jgi:hypothetical protein
LLAAGFLCHAVDEGYEFSGFHDGQYLAYAENCQSAKAKLQLAIANANMRT